MPGIAALIPFSDLTSFVHHYDMTCPLLAVLRLYVLVQGRHLMLGSVQPLLRVPIPLISACLLRAGYALDARFCTGVPP